MGGRIERKYYALIEGERGAPAEVRSFRTRQERDMFVGARAFVRPVTNPVTLQFLDQATKKPAGHWDKPLKIDWDLA